MKNLKLNQLNKQKMSESDMNVLKGGEAPNMPVKKIAEVNVENCGGGCLSSVTSDSKEELKADTWSWFNTQDIKNPCERLG